VYESIFAGVIQITAAAESTDIHSNVNKTLPQPAATEVHFEHLENRYYTGSPPTSQSHEYMNDDEHYDSYHHQQDGPFASASASSLISRGKLNLNFSKRLITTAPFIIIFFQNLTNDKSPHKRKPLCFVFVGIKASSLKVLKQKPF
jgi:hypothetical protein